MNIITQDNAKVLTTSDDVILMIINIRRTSCTQDHLLTDFPKSAPLLGFVKSDLQVDGLYQMWSVYRSMSLQVDGVFHRLNGSNDTNWKHCWKLQLFLVCFLSVLLSCQQTAGYSCGSLGQNGGREGWKLVSSLRIANILVGNYSEQLTNGMAGIQQPCNQRIRLTVNQSTHFISHSGNRLEHWNVKLPAVKEYK